MKHKLIREIEDEFGLPRIGTIRKGIKDERGRPREVGYFVIQPADDDPGLKALIKETYGPAPVRLPVLFPGATTDDVLSVVNEAWGASGLQHRCDGEYVELYYDAEARQMVRVPHGEMKCPGGCSLVARLAVVLPHLRLFGQWTVVSGARQDAVNWYKQLRLYERTSDGNLASLVFELVRRKRAYSYHDDKGKRRRGERYFVDIDLASYSMTPILRTRLNREALGGLLADGVIVNSDLVPLDAPRLVDMETGEIVESTNETIEVVEVVGEPSQVDEAAGETVEPDESGDVEIDMDKVEEIDQSGHDAKADSYERLWRHMEGLNDLARRTNAGAVIQMPETPPSTEARRHIFNRVSGKVRTIEAQIADRVGVPTPKGTPEKRLATLRAAVEKWEKEGSK